MSDYKVSSRYAKSLIELSRDKKNLDKVYGDVIMLLESLEGSRDLRVMLQSPIIKHSKKKEILNILFKGKIDAMTLSFLDILCNKNRESLLYPILEEFVNQYNVISGIQVAQIITTIPLTDDLRKEFSSLVTKISGKSKVQLEESIDTSIIGGFILKIGDRQIDDSVSGKLSSLRRQLLA